MVDRGGATKRLVVALAGAALVLVASGCATVSPSATSSDESSQPSPTASTPTPELVTRSISGTATVATTGLPVAGVRIQGRSLPPPEQPDPPAATAVTDANGAYTLTFLAWPPERMGENSPALFLTLELPPGYLLVSMTKTDFPFPRALPTQLVLGLENLDVGPIDITLGPGHIVEGRATDGLTGAPLARVRVSALMLNSILIDGGFGDAFGIAAAASTDANGRYSLTVPSGSYVIYASEQAPGARQRFWSEDPTVFQATPLSVERSIAGVNIALVPVTEIRGDVVSGPREFTDAALADRELAALPIVAGARVVAYLAGDTPCCRIGGVAITGEQGSFLMYVPPGIYRIEFTPPAEAPYAAEWWSEAADFASATDVNVGSDPIQLEVELSRTAP